MSERSQHDVMSHLIAYVPQQFPRTLLSTRRTHDPANVPHCLVLRRGSRARRLLYLILRPVRMSASLHGSRVWLYLLAAFFQPIHIIDVFIHLSGCKGREHYTSRKLAREVYSTLTLISDDPGLHRALLRTA
jgi:hypothetical protein